MTSLNAPEVEKQVCEIAKFAYEPMPVEDNGSGVHNAFRLLFEEVQRFADSTTL
jgi:hypothetical protein